MQDEDGDGVFSATLLLNDGVYEYKYINGNNWGQDEGILPTSVDEAMKPRIEVYPNPASEAFTLQGDARIVNATYRLYNSRGQVAKTGRILGATTVIGIAGIANGNYQLVIFKDEYTSVKKVTILK